jgi:hypothetical protein
MLEYKNIYNILEFHFKKKKAKYATENFHCNLVFKIFNIGITK